MLEKTCVEPYSWEGAKGESSSLQIIQKPDAAFDYAAGYKSIYKELSGRELSAPLDELTQPLVLIPHLTLYTLTSPPGVFPFGEVYLKFGVRLADLVSSFTDVWLGSISVEEAVFKAEIENFRGHICAESLALEFHQVAPGTAKLILISAKADPDRGLLMRLWLQTHGAGAWRSIGYTWIDRRAFIGPASVPMEKEIRPRKRKQEGRLGLLGQPSQQPS
jgi:hypothetical protein